MKMNGLITLALGVAVAHASTEFVVRDTIPDTFDLGQSKAAKLSLAAPDGGGSTYDIDAAAGFWTDFAEADATSASAGRYGVIGELHRATVAKNPTDNYRVSAVGWVGVSPNPTIYFPTQEGISYQRNRLKDSANFQAFLNASLILPRNPREKLPWWRCLFWSTSYAPISDTGLLMAGTPTAGINFQAASSGGTGRITRMIARYTASIKGAGGPLEKFSLDFSWIYQRKLGASGTLDSPVHDWRRTTVALNYAFNENVGLVMERDDGEDPLAATGRQHLTTIALKVKFGRGPSQ
jgi:hypothetical protein